MFLEESKSNITKTKLKILFCQCYASGKYGTSFLLRYPNKYREYLLKIYPEMKIWAKKKYFSSLEKWPDFPNVFMDEINVVGHLFSKNLNTQSIVVDKPVNPESLIQELKKDLFSHVAISLIQNDYTNFVRCVKAIREYDPKIEIIVGGPGALFQDTVKYSDHLCQKDGIKYLREMLKENNNNSYKICVMPDHYNIENKGRTISLDSCRIITKIGCPMQCDFCATSRLNTFTGNVFTPQEVHDALVDYRDSKNLKKLQVYFVEPTTIFSLKWWYELFELFKEDHGEFSFLVYSLASVLDRLDLEKISNSAARINVVNFGIESFRETYSKTGNVNIKALIRRLRDYGIMSNANYIIGYDYDSKKSVWTDVKKLVSLDADMISVLNLTPNPGTSIWNGLKEENRLLNLPPDFYCIPGFQPFLHPNFAPGFKDMLPLLYEVYKYMEAETCNLIYNTPRTMRNLLQFPKNSRSIKREIKSYEMMRKDLYGEWKRFFSPTEVQNNKFIAKTETQFITPIKDDIILKT